MEWCNHKNNHGYISSLLKKLKDEGELLKFCKLIDRFAEMKRRLSREKDTINNLIQQDERSSKVKSSFQNLQEAKPKLNRAYENVCGLLSAESVGRLSIFDKDIKKFKLKIQQKTADSLNYVDWS